MTGTIVIAVGVDRRQVGWVNKRMDFDRQRDEYCVKIQEYQCRGEELKHMCMHHHLSGHAEYGATTTVPLGSGGSEDFLERWRSEVGGG